MLYGQSEVCTFLETDTGANRPNIFQMAKKEYHLKLKKMTYIGWKKQKAQQVWKIGMGLLILSNRNFFFLGGEISQETKCVKDWSDHIMYFDRLMVKKENNHKRKYFYKIESPALLENPLWVLI